MEVKEHKSSEISMIPVDWHILPFNLVSTMKGRIGWQGLNEKEFTMNADEPFLITGMNFKDGEIRWDEVYHVSEDRYEVAKEIQLKVGDVLMTKDGTIGKLLFVDKIPYPGKATLNSHLLVFRPIKNSYIPKFLYYQLISKSFKDHIETSKSGTTFFGISQTSVGKYGLIIPPIPEQAEIASILSDTDALIEHLQKLITKKKAIKQGTMQQLLTGKKRLSGFSEKWDVKKLGEIGATYGGLSGKTKSDFNEGKYPYIPFMNIMSNPVIDLQYFDYVNIRGDEKQNKAAKGDLFFNGSSETPKEVGMCSVLQRDIPNLYLNSFCFGFRLNKDLKTNGLYLSYFFRSPIGRQLIFSLAQGATRYNLSKTNFMNLEIPYPEPSEQTAIVSILFDMDTEIEKLESQHTKYKNMKQGIMRQLLTGKIRIYASN